MTYMDLISIIIVTFIIFALAIYFCLQYDIDILGVLEHAAKHTFGKFNKK